MGKRDRRRVVTGSGAHETRLGPGAEPEADEAGATAGGVEAGSSQADAGPPSGAPSSPGGEGSRATPGPSSAASPEAASEVTPSRRRLTPGTGDATTVGIVAPGQVLNGHYRLVREIARGGMGVVYEAEDLKLEGRVVAVKVLPPEVAKDLASVVRLKREAQAVALLDHPGIVRLMEFNDDGDCHYLVMEYLNGDNLALHVANHERLPLDEVLDLARQVCPALVYAHGKGVLHRDIKPANLMFKVDGDHRHVKITDFGIASQVKDSMTRLTGQESAGTLLYISPEQLRGKKPSPASDQYSLAATLYELLSGEPPFTGGGLSHQILEAAPEPLDGVPTHVNFALMRALAKEPEARFADCGAFLAALEGRSAAAVAARDGAVGAGAGSAAVGAATSGAGRAQGAEPAAPARGGSRIVVAALALLAVAVVAWGLGLSRGTIGGPAGPAGRVGRALETWTNDLGLQFVFCPPGEFDMGFESDAPVHRVRIGQGFWMGAHEVTQGQWRAVMGSNPSTFQGGPGDDRRPVEGVTWNDCQEFARRMGVRDGNRYRLPSEAEWDYAWRAGSDLSWARDTEALGWFASNSEEATHPVGGKRPNPWGLYDMAGNVWEWCQDTWHMDVGDAPRDGSAWEGGGVNKVLRGGAYDHSIVHWRTCSVPYATGDDYGLRLVAEPRAGGPDAAAGVPSMTPSPAVTTSAVESTRAALPTTPVPTRPPVPTTPVPTTPLPPPVPTTPVPRRVRVSFESDPTGAKVYCVELPPERKYVGRTGEGPVAVDLEPGTWTFKFVMAGYRDGIRTVEVAAGGRPQTVRETLVDRHGFIDVTVEPAGVAVTLDGKPVVVAGGRGQLRAAPGRHTVAASREGFEDASEAVSVADGATVSARLVLREKPTEPTPVPVSGRVGETWTNSLGMKFSWCPPGEFDMGGADREARESQKPVHRVRIPRGFWLGTYEVTQGEWQAVMGSNPASFKGDGRRPVEQVSWDDCQVFVQRLAARDGNGYRLPSEAEWEYACRAGTTAAWYGDRDAVAWYEGNSDSTTHAVGGKLPNPWGLYDMLGNVWEWCQDAWHDTYAGAPTDGSARDVGSGNRVVRGGAFGYFADFVRAAGRVSLGSANRDRLNGVRVIALPRVAGHVGGATVSSRLALREKPMGPTPVPVSGRVGETWTNSIGMKFSWCPPGEFDMGSPESEPGRFDDEGPVHRVRIPRGFWLGTYEVTQGAWRAVLGADPAAFKGDDLRPVEQVSWHDCQEFLRKLGGTDGNAYRLPSEAEWEYACRSGTTGSRYGEPVAVAWHDATSGSTTHAVGWKQASPWGLCDMLGNVWEWCQDTWHDSYTGGPPDGSAWDAGSGDRVLRGGAYSVNVMHSRAASRHHRAPDYRAIDFGVRVVAVPGAR